MINLSKKNLNNFTIKINNFPYKKSKNKEKILIYKNKIFPRKKTIYFSNKNMT